MCEWKCSHVHLLTISLISSQSPSCSQAQDILSFLFFVIFAPKLQTIFPHLLRLALFIPEMSRFHHLNPPSPSVSPLLRLLTDWKSGTERCGNQIRGERGERGRRGERSERGRRAEWALRQKAFWFKAMTLVSDVWTKQPIWEGRDSYGLSVFWCVQHVFTDNSSNTAAWGPKLETVMLYLSL